jgi:hypothetical protein
MMRMATATATAYKSFDEHFVNTVYHTHIGIDGKPFGRASDFFLLGIRSCLCAQCNRTNRSDRIPRLDDLFIDKFCLSSFVEAIGNVCLRSGTLRTMGNDDINTMECKGCCLCR